MSYSHDYRVDYNRSQPPYKDKEYMVRLSGHTFIVGKTGMGKTNYLKLVINSLREQDCDLIVLDPHGELADYALMHSGKKRVILSGNDYPGSEEFHSGINALKAESSKEAYLVSDWLTRAFSEESTLSQGTWGPRLEFVFTVLLPKFIIANKGATLKDFIGFLNDRQKLKEFIETSENSSIFNFLIPQISDRRIYGEFVASTMNKLAPVTENPLISDVLAVPAERALNLEEILGWKNVILIPEVNRGQVGGVAARVISTLFLAQIWNALQKIDNLRFERYIIIDEAQEIPIEILKELMSQGRKYGIHLILSTQTFSGTLKGHMPEIFANVSNWVCFQMSDDDAGFLAKNLVIHEEQDTLRYALKRQLPYRATITTMSSEQNKYYGPKTVTPPLDENRDSIDDVNLIKSDILHRFGYVKPAPIIPEPPKMDPHEEMIAEFTRILEAENLEYKRENVLNNLIPDITFKIGGEQIICEVEYSDLSSKFLIAKKMYNYRNDKLVMIVYDKHFNNLISVIRTITENNIAGQNNIQTGPEEISVYGTLTSLSSIYVVVYKDGKFYFYNGKDFDEFWVGCALGPGSFILRARNLPQGAVRENLIERVILNPSNRRNFTKADLKKELSTARATAFITSLKNRGYEDLNLLSILELDRIHI